MNPEEIIKNPAQNLSNPAEIKKDSIESLPEKNSIPQAQNPDATLAVDIQALEDISKNAAPTIDSALSLSKPTAISTHPDKLIEDKSLEILNGSDK